MVTSALGLRPKGNRHKLGRHDRQVSTKACVPLEVEEATTPPWLATCVVTSHIVHYAAPQPRDG